MIYRSAHNILLVLIGLLFLKIFGPSLEMSTRHFKTEKHPTFFASIHITSIKHIREEPVNVLRATAILPAPLTSTWPHLRRDGWIKGNINRTVSVLQCCVLSMAAMLSAMHGHTAGNIPLYTTHSPSWIQSGVVGLRVSASVPKIFWVDYSIRVRTQPRGSVIVRSTR